MFSSLCLLMQAFIYVCTYVYFMKQSGVFIVILLENRQLNLVEGISLLNRIWQKVSLPKVLTSS